MKRITVNLLTKTEKDLVWLKENNEMGISDAVNRGVALLAWLEREKLQGMRLALIDQGGSAEAVILL